MIQRAINSGSVLAGNERTFHQPVDQKLVLAGINVRNATMVDVEVQTVRGDDAVKQLMRRARVRSLRQAVGIVDQADHVLFER